MERILIFDTLLSGHHLEYIHHIHERVAGDKKHKYVFVVPVMFKEIKDNYTWRSSRNCEFDFISKTDIERCSKGNRFSYSYKSSKLLSKYVRKHKADKVFLIMLMLFMPFILFMLPCHTKISGIIYRIFLYEGKNTTYGRKMINFMLFRLLAKSKATQKLLILNDKSATSYFNRVLSTTKFDCLLDPVCISENKGMDIRNALNVKENQKIFLHFGGITGRKGSMKILESIGYLTEEEQKQYVFIFAGRIYDDIKEQFYRQYNLLKKNCNILVFDKFCSYKFINDLCQSCDIILLPYSNTTQSSGLIGYASTFQKPVIGPAIGLLGKLIRRNHLGIVLKTITGETLAKSYSDALAYKCSNSYAKNHTIQRFMDIIIGAIS